MVSVLLNLVQGIHHSTLDAGFDTQKVSKAERFLCYPDKAFKQTGEGPMKFSRSFTIILRDEREIIALIVMVEWQRLHFDSSMDN